jgi:hypothetical protein
LKYLFNVLALLLLLSFSANATTIYVKKSATGSKNGTSWTNAYTDLQNALDAATTSDQIWVAAGTYLPTDAPDGTTSTGATDRNNAFHLGTDMKIYGGFAGTETQLSQRDAATNITILSGDFNTDDGVTGSGSTLSITGNTENAYHVMITAELTVAAVIDGFTIKGGNANVSGSISYQSKTYHNGNGGGMYNSSSSPTITNTTFLHNTAVYGGGMFNIDSAPIITNTTFLHNTASSIGGGMFNQNSSAPIITNTTFLYNTAGSIGGGMYNNNSSNPIITNTTFSYNTAISGGGGMYNDSSDPMIKNSIFWENLKNGSNSVPGADIANASSSPTVSYCLTQNYSSGTEIINNQDPLFVDATNGNFSLKGCSPAINTGTATGITHTTDILGNPLVGIVDMGAYEYQGMLYSTNIYVDIDAQGANDGSSWTNAYTDLQDAIDNQCGGFDIWVAAGTYLPTASPDGTTTDNRNKAFHLATDMKTYGGFDGTETQLSQRNAVTNITILSGDFDGDDGVTGSGSTFAITGNTENAYHVMITANLTVASAIDGFTIKGGNANGSGTINYQSKTYNNSNGGGMYNYSCFDLMIKNSIFSYNTADEDGGGMYNYSSNPTITNTTFLYNTAFHGGGMCNYRSSSTITNTTFSYNTADEGGGMYNYVSLSTIITNTTFSYNTSGNYGGGMYNYQSSLIITNTTFLYNTAAIGGGMYNYSSWSLTITNTTFLYNTAEYGGGGMYNYSCYDLMITNTTFLYNRANVGGGMYNYISSLIITNTVFSYNTASYDGGGMYNSYSSPTITNTTFLHNTAVYDGGGMINEMFSSPTIENTTFSYNTSNRNGGGMYNYSSNPIITNTVFWENLKSNSNNISGADIANSASSPTVSYCLTQENSVYDGANNGVNNNGTGIINNQ